MQESPTHQAYKHFLNFPQYQTEVQKHIYNYIGHCRHWTWVRNMLTYINVSTRGKLTSNVGHCQHWCLQPVPTRGKLTSNVGWNKWNVSAPVTSSTHAVYRNNPLDTIMYSRTLHGFTLVKLNIQSKSKSTPRVDSTHQVIPLSRRVSMLCRIVIKWVKSSSPSLDSLSSALYRIETNHSNSSSPSVDSPSSSVCCFILMH